MKKNNSEEAIKRNVEYACTKLPAKWLNNSMCVFDGEVAIIGGAPSVKNKLDEIKALPEQTMILSVNGTHDWLVENGIEPDFYVCLDSRACNDFVKKPLDNCVYFLASQCHKNMFRNVLSYNLILWHCDDGILDKDFIADEAIKRNIIELLFIAGKGTVTLTSMCLAHTLGFRKFKLFGMDCSFSDKQHAYDQPQNNKDKIIKMKLGTKTYKTTPNLAGQLFTYFEMQDLFKDSKIEICSEGLIKDVNQDNIKKLKEVA